MDPNIVKTIAEILGPAIGLFICGAVPVSIIFMTRYFKLRTREMELDAELHGRELDSRLRALESRQGATESAITALANGLSIGRGNEQHRALMEAPPDETPQTRPPMRLTEK
jgi:hypothetical protein